MNTKMLLLVGGIIILAVIATYFASPNLLQNSNQSQGTIFGTVLIGPDCPVVTDPADPQCINKPYKTRLVATTVDEVSVIKEFNSDSEGKFSVKVPAGEYTIRSAAAAEVLPYCSSNEVIRVEPNKSTEVPVSCDTGIR